MKKLILLLLICAIAAVAVYALVFKDASSGNNDKESVNNEDGGGGESFKDTIQSAFSAHPNKDPEKAKAGLEKAGYDVSLKTYTSREDGRIAYVDAALDTETMDAFEWVMIYYYKDKAAAEAAWPELEQEGEEMKEAAAYLGYASSFVCKKNGTVIYYGTKNAVDAAK